MAAPFGSAMSCWVNVSYINLPEFDGVRNDSALYEGYEVSVHYDPMVAKLIVHADTRQECIELTKQALDQYQIVGFKTTIPFCRQVLDSEPFVTGKYSTFFVKDHWPLSIPSTFLSQVASIAALGYTAEDERRQPLPSDV